MRMDLTLREGDLPDAPWPVTERDVDYDTCIDALLQARPETAACA